MEIKRTDIQCIEDIAIAKSIRHNDLYKIYNGDLTGRIIGLVDKRHNGERFAFRATTCSSTYNSFSLVALRSIAKLIEQLEMAEQDT